MTQQAPASSSRTWIWVVALIALTAWRLPALVRPSGGDQHLYTYTAGRVLAGDVPYRDAWDQKPPGIFFVYALGRAFWPDVHVIPVLDLLASVATALLLVGLGRRMFGGRVGEAAAIVYLLLSDPGIERSGGMYLRAQCETFIELAVTAALASVWRSSPGPRAWFEAGLFLAVTFWLKYNALAFSVPIALAVAFNIDWSDWPRTKTAARWLVAGFVSVSAVVFIYFWAGHALTDLWLATITYNVRYAGETYTGALDALSYVLTMPLARAHVNGLWFAGLVGLLLLAVHWRRAPRAVLVTAAWIAAAVLSIAVNGARSLPQYFIQAAPALALAAAAGLAIAWRERHRARIVAIIAALLVVGGAWRVGVEGPPTQPRLFGLQQAAANIADDIAYWRGELSPTAYLARFDRGEEGKFSLLAIDRLRQRIDIETSASDRILVFGFAGGGVLVQAGRQSASRFFWSRAVVLEFEAGRPGYGSAGLLDDLTRTRPALVALQKHDWGLAELTTPDSIRFFMNQPDLRAWLESGYALDYEDNAFVVWRRKT
jgi:hypothetical protein